MKKTEAKERKQRIETVRLRGAKLERKTKENYKNNRNQTSEVGRGKRWWRIVGIKRRN